MANRFSITLEVERRFEFEIESSNATLSLGSNAFSFELMSAVIDTRAFAISEVPDNQVGLAVDGGLYVPPPQLASAQW